MSGCLVALKAIRVAVAGQMEKMKSDEEARMGMGMPVFPCPCWLLAWALSVA